MISDRVDCTATIILLRVLYKKLMLISRNKNHFKQSQTVFTGEKHVGTNKIQATLASFASVAPISEKAFLSIAFLHVLHLIHILPVDVYTYTHTKKKQVLVML